MATDTGYIDGQREATPSGRSDGSYHRGPLEILGEGEEGQQGDVRSENQRSQIDAEAGRLLRLIRISQPPPCPMKVSRVARRILAKLG